jgi:threonine/homoserine/homoserine lactone efflux protein
LGTFFAEVFLPEGLQVSMMYEMLAILATAFAIGLTGALAPGPTLVAAVNSTLKSGWTAGPKVAAGHAAVELFIFVLISLGLAAAAQQYSRYVAVAGGAALVAFGLLTVKGSRSARLATPAEGVSGNPYLAGVLTSVANPYFWVWWLSVGSALILDGLRGGLLMAGLFMIGHWGADFAWYTVVSTGLYQGKNILSEANYQRIMTVCGLFLILFGLYYLTGT